MAKSSLSRGAGDPGARRERVIAGAGVGGPGSDVSAAGGHRHADGLRGRRPREIHPRRARRHGAARSESRAREGRCRAAARPARPGRGPRAGRPARLPAARPHGGSASRVRQPVRPSRMRTSVPWGGGSAPTRPSRSVPSIGLADGDPRLGRRRGDRRRAGEHHQREEGRRPAGARRGRVSGGQVPPPPLDLCHRRVVVSAAGLPPSGRIVRARNGRPARSGGRRALRALPRGHAAGPRNDEGPARCRAIRRGGG